MSNIVFKFYFFGFSTSTDESLVSHFWEKVSTKWKLNMLLKELKSLFLFQMIITLSETVLVIQQ